MKGTRCRRCPASIVFVAMDSGKLMPVDPLPDELGNVVCTRDELGRYLHGQVIPAGLPVPDGYVRFMPHFATCARPEDRSVPEPSNPEPWPPDPLF